MEYISRDQITALGNIDDYFELLDKQDTESKELGYHLVGAEELQMVTEAVANAYQPELPERKNLSIILRQLGKRVLAAINREQRKEQGRP